MCIPELVLMFNSIYYVIVIFSKFGEIFYCRHSDRGNKLIAGDFQEPVEYFNGTGQFQEDDDVNNYIIENDREYVI